MKEVKDISSFDFGDDEYYFSFKDGKLHATHNNRLECRISAPEAWDMKPHIWCPEMQDRYDDLMAGTVATVKRTSDAMMDKHTAVVLRLNAEFPELNMARSRLHAAWSTAKFEAIR